MATVAKKLDLKIGDLVEIEGRRYRVVSNGHGGVTFTPAPAPTQPIRAADDETPPATSD